MSSVIALARSALLPVRCVSSTALPLVFFCFLPWWQRLDGNSHRKFSVTGFYVDGLPECHAVTAAKLLQRRPGFGLEPHAGWPAGRFDIAVDETAKSFGSGDGARLDTAVAF